MSEWLKEHAWKASPFALRAQPTFALCASAGKPQLALVHRRGLACEP